MTRIECYMIGDLVFYHAEAFIVLDNPDETHDVNGFDAIVEVITNSLPVVPQFEWRVYNAVVAQEDRVIR